jgi:nucleoside-diphosphate-sugar epimerase
LAKAVGARPPWRVPVWLGRLFIGEAGVSMMTLIRGASNAKAKRELGWQPRYATWRTGFSQLQPADDATPAAGLGASLPAARLR